MYIEYTNMLYALYVCTCIEVLHVFHLQDLNDLELGVHNQYVLFLRFSLSLDCVSIGVVG